MKKNDLFVLGSTVVYTFLFHHEFAGLNFLLFSLFLILILLLAFPDKAKKTKWLLAMAGTAVSGFGVFYLGNNLSILANILSLCLLSAFTFEPRTSVFSAWGYGLFSLITAAGYMVLDFIRKIDNGESNPPRPKRKIGFLSFLLPLLVLVVFFSLYQSGNVLFHDFTKNINLDFLTPSLIFFFMGGFFLMYAFFRYKAIPELIVPESQIPDTLVRQQLKVSGLRSFFPLSQEYASALMVLVLVNLLSLILNILDCKFLFVDGKLPAGISYSEFVHQGVGLLIFSIILAILILLFYFRGELNFTKGKKLMSWLALIWVAQNIFMVYTSTLKNGLYIHEYSLTYKRIGVYAWLLLAVFGLITTAFKIYKVKTNFFLLRINAWLVYGALVISCIYNWDRFIAEYNILNSKNVDYGYLLSLSYNTLPAIVEASEKYPFPEQKEENYSRCINCSSFNKQMLRNELSDFFFEQRYSAWPSHCISKGKVEKELLSIPKSHGYTSLARN